jgi:transcriptional regulator with XRE-family HTH domain
LRTLTAVPTTPAPTLTEVARRVRAARAYAGLTVVELADRLGMGVQTIKRIESGRRTARVFELAAIAEACELPREFFELDFQEMWQQAAAQRELLARIDDRLGRLDQALRWDPPRISLR